MRPGRPHHKDRVAQAHSHRALPFLVDDLGAARCLFVDRGVARLGQEEALPCHTVNAGFAEAVIPG